MSEPSPILDENREPEFEDLGRLADVPVRLRVVVGRARRRAIDVLALRSGSILRLDREVGEPVDLEAAGRVLATGLVLPLEDAYAFKITEILEPR